MVIEVAKWRYLRDHPDRKRSPRKFTEGISLTLTSVEDGSAIPAIALSLATVELLFAPQQAYLEQARDAIVGAIGAAAEDKSPTDFLPSKGLAYFDRLGRSLRQDEAIEFSTAAPRPPARLTKQTRLRLLRAAEIKNRTEEIHMRGGIFHFNQEELSFEMLLPDGGKVAGPVGTQHYDTIMEAFHGYRQGVKVQIDGIGRFNQSDRLQKIESVNHITLLDPLDLQSQIEELRTLKDGWYDGKGKAPPAEELDWLSETLDEYYPDNLGLPYLYPVAEGGVRLEWSIGRRDISLEIDLRRRSGEWHSLDLDTDEEEARPLAMDDKDDWTWIAACLQGLSEAVS